MSKHTFNIVFDGPALRSHELEIAKLATSLISIDKLIQEANSVINGTGLRIKSTVKGTFTAGSFKYQISTTYTNLKDKITDFLPGFEADVCSISTLIAIVTAIFQLVVCFKGRASITTQELEGVTFITHSKMGKYEEKIITLYQNINVRKYAHGSLYLLKEEGVDSFGIVQDNGEPEMLVRKEERKYFDIENEENKVNSTESKKLLTLISPYFSGQSHLQWKFFDGSQAISAPIEDTNFLKMLKDDAIIFRGNNEMDVIIREEQHKVPGSLKIKFFIVRVLKVNGEDIGT